MAGKITKLAVAGAVTLSVLAGAATTSGATGRGNEGCTPGYWKNHTEVWDGNDPSDFGGQWEPFSPGAQLQHAFSNTINGVKTYAFEGIANPEVSQYATATMLQALNFGGGGGDAGAARILLRAATAALLNAAYDFPGGPNVGYPIGRNEIITQLKAALNGTRADMLALAAELDRMNNLGCPL